MSTIQNVARHAGVSISTVSNLLNGRTDRMGKETLARVQAAITALNFKPNSAARRLKTGHTPLLGLLVPSTANPIYGVIARQIETAAQDRYGHRVLLGNTYRDKAKETAFFDDLVTHGVRGVIVISSLVDEAHYESAVQRGLVVVSYDRRATPGTRSSIDHVSVDNVEAARIATTHLIERGHKRLAFVTPAGQTMSRSEKIKGFLAAARKAGLQDSAQVIEGEAKFGYGDSDLSDVGRLQAARIAALPVRQRPTGVVGVNDLLAFGLMAGFRDAGLRVPEDVSVVGIDGLFLSALVYPALTTVSLPVDAMASTIVERIMLRLADPAIETGEFLFKPALVERQSVAARRGAKSRVSE